MLSFSFSFQISDSHGRMGSNCYSACQNYIKVLKPIPWKLSHQNPFGIFAGKHRHAQNKYNVEMTF